MIPRLKTSDNSKFLGALSDAIECTVEEERNGIYQLHMVYPVDGIHFSDIKTLNIISAVPARGEAAQLFDIFRISMPQQDRIEVDAKHISYRLNKYTVMPFQSLGTWADQAFLRMTQHRVEDTGFSFSSDIAGPPYADIVVGAPTSVRAVLGLVLDAFGGEYEWNNFNVNLLTQRGSDRGVTLRYGVNITDFRQENNIEETVTGIVPYWKGRDAGGSDVVVTLAQQVVRVSGYFNYPYQRTVPVDFSSDFKTPPTESQLLSAAQNYISVNNVGVPKVDIDISFVQLSDSEEYKSFHGLDTLNLCDTVKVYYTKLGVTATAKVVRTVYDVLKDRYREITIGDAKIRGQSVNSAVAPVKKQVSQISNAVTALTENEEALVTLPSNYTSGGSTRNFYRRKGNICMVGLDATPSAHVSGNTIFTLPASCRPVIACRYSVLPGVSRASDDGNDHYVIINTDGTVTYTGTGRVFNTFTFICNGG